MSEITLLSSTDHGWGKSERNLDSRTLIPAAINRRHEQSRLFYFHNDCKKATKSVFCCCVRLRLKRWS